MNCTPPGRPPTSCGCFATGLRRPGGRINPTVSHEDMEARAASLNPSANHFPELSDAGFVAPVERPLFDSLAADETGLRQNLQVFARGRLAHPEFTRDENTTHAVADQVAFRLLGEMPDRVLEPLQNLQPALVRECMKRELRFHIDN